MTGIEATRSDLLSQIDTTSGTTGAGHAEVQDFLRQRGNLQIPNDNHLPLDLKTLYGTPDVHLEGRDNSPSPSAKTSALDSERLHLVASARQSLPILAFFQNDMRRFEDRIKSGQISPDEAARTYQQISRLFDSKGTEPTNSDDRRNLAMQIMHQAANPGHISQGAHNTCNVTTIESRTYTKYPAEAAGLVADVALTGRFTAKDGSNLTVKIGSKPADDEAMENPLDGKEADGHRSYASQLFQVTAVNLHWQTVPGMRYEQRPLTPEGRAAGDTGEVIIAGGGDKVFVKNNPLMQLDYLQDIANKISGHNDRSFILVNSSDGKDDKEKFPDVAFFQSEQEFARQLSSIKSKGQFPAVLFVHADEEPFYTDSNGGDVVGPKDGHGITVRDFDPKTNTVLFDNQWNLGANHDTPQTAVSLADLYRATLAREDYQTALKADIAAAQRENKPSPSFELALLHSEHTIDTGKDVQYDAAINGKVQDILTNWSTERQGLTPEAQARLQRQMENLVSGTNSEGCVNFVKAEHAAGLISSDKYRELLADNLVVQVQNSGQVIPVLRNLISSLPTGDRQLVIMRAKAESPGTDWQKFFSSSELASL
jgi:hypothetical protein